MRFLLLSVCFLLFCALLQAERIDVDIVGGVYCVHDMKKVASAKVHAYNQGYMGYEKWIGTSEVADDGYYNVNETIDTWHHFIGRLEIDHQCINDLKAKDQSITLSIHTNKGQTKFVLAPIILDTQKPTEEQFEQLYAKHPYLRNHTSDFILSYKTPPAKWWMLWPYLKDLKIH